MDIFAKLKTLKKEHSDSFSALNSLLNELESSDFLKENAHLRSENSVLQEQITQTHKKAEQLREKNRDLKEALSEQIISERTNIIRVSKQKLDALFQNNKDLSDNRLSSLERRYLDDLNRVKTSITEEIDARSAALEKEISALIEKTKEHIAALKDQQAQHLETIRHASETEYRDLQESDLDEKTIERRTRQNKIELKIGLGMVNKIGVFLILLGIGASAQYSYTHFFNAHLKGAFFFLIALLLSGGGEIAYRRKHVSFASGLSGGGIAALYGALFYSHFVLEIISMTPALLLAILIAASSVVMAIRYNSQTIAIISLIGGYLPFFSYSFSFDFTQPTAQLALLYLTLLNVTLLAIAYLRSWRLVNYISFIFNTPCTLYLISEIDSLPFTLTALIGIFIIYQAVVLIKPLKHKLTPTILDLVLLGINSVVASLTTFILFEVHNLPQYDGVIALSFAAVFIAQGLFVYRVMKVETITTIVLLGGGLTFSALAIPFQFGIEWSLFGWLIEGLFLAFAGNRYKLFKIEKIGWAVLFVTTLFFYLFDVVPYLNDNTVAYFTFKYLSVTTCSFLLLGYYKIYNKIELNNSRFQVVTIMSWLAAINLWFMTLALIPYHIHNSFVTQIDQQFETNIVITDFFIPLSLSCAHLLLALFFKYSAFYKERAFRLLPIISASVSTFILLIINFSPPQLLPESSRSNLQIIALILLIVYNLMLLPVIRYIIQAFIKSRYASLEIYPAAMALWLLTVLISLLTIQFDLQLQSIIVTSSILIFSLLSITYGFIRRFRYIRIAGLGLVVTTLAKFFIFDLSHLSLEYRIISFFVYGVILITISFIYQKINNRMVAE